MTQVCKKPPGSPKLALRCCGPLDELLNPSLFKALCDPTRTAIVACLTMCARPCTVGEIAECCRVDLSVVSRHLTLLAAAGVLGCSKRGRTVWYSVRAVEVCERLRSLADAIEACQPGPCAPSPAGLAGGKRVRSASGSGLQSGLRSGSRFAAIPAQTQLSEAQGGGASAVSAASVTPRSTPRHS